MTKNKKNPGKKGSKSNIHDVKMNKGSKNGSSEYSKSQKSPFGQEDTELNERNSNEEHVKSDDEMELEVPVMEDFLLDKDSSPETTEGYSGESLANTIIENYEGERNARGAFSGYGIAEFVGGNVYEGYFSNGVMHGRGKYKWVNGTVYEGDFDYNQISGYGRYEWPDDSFYEGNVLNGIRHGVGVFKNLKLDISYSGQWKFGKRHGKAIMHYSEHSWYEGDWVNNVRHGWGVRRYQSGNVYEGQWMNGKRHGEGTMRWLNTNEYYSGMWNHGIQHGYGTHTWYLQRVPGSQYLLRNEYVGEFVNSLRHGKGKFFFASGAVYSGEWENNKKHGWGKFIFKNGRVFEGQFENDHMVEHPEFAADGSEAPETNNIRTRTPLGKDETQCQGLLNMSMFGPGVSLDLGFILKDFKPEEHVDVVQQLSFLLLRNVSVLRRIYSFYSGLGHDRSPDNTFVMTRFQFWRFLKDCKIHHHSLTLSNMDSILSSSGTIDDMHNPMQKILLREFLNNIVVLSYKIFKDEKSDNEKEAKDKMSVLTRCFGRILKDHILVNSCKVAGNLLFDPQYAVAGLSYMSKCWEIYHLSCQPRSKAPFDQIMTLRQFLFLLKDLKVLGPQLSTATVFKVFSADDPGVMVNNNYNVGMEITFLEFFEALIGCAKEFTAEQKPANDPTEEPVLPAGPESVYSEHLEQETLSGSQHPESNFEMGVSAPLGGTGEFLQTLSQLTLHDEVGNAVEEPVMLADEIEKELGSPEVEVTKQQQEFDEWNQKLSYFFIQTLFPSWEHHQMMKEEVIKYRNTEAAKARIKAMQEQQAAMLQNEQEINLDCNDQLPGSEKPSENDLGANKPSCTEVQETEHAVESRPEQSPQVGKRKNSGGSKKKKK